MNKYDEDLRLDLTVDEHIPMNVDDYLHLYDMLDNLPFEYFYVFPDLSTIKALCKAEIDERCRGGKHNE